MKQCKILNDFLFVGWLFLEGVVNRGLKWKGLNYIFIFQCISKNDVYFGNRNSWYGVKSKVYYGFGLVSVQCNLLSM